MKKEALDIFLSNSKYKLTDISQTKVIHEGYTNISYLFQLNNGEKYQVRIGKNNDLVDRKSENYIISLVASDLFLYHNKKNGNAIKKWIPGHTPTVKNILKKSFLKKLNHEIVKLQKLEFDTNLIKKLDYSFYLSKASNTIDKEIIQKYLSLIAKYKSLPLYLSHSDINPENMIINKKRITLIDWEWVSQNNMYWDYANFIRETLLPFNLVEKITKFNKELNLVVLKDHIFICSCFAWQWSLAVEQTEKIKKYTKFCESKTKDYYNLLYK